MYVLIIAFIVWVLYQANKELDNKVAREKRINEALKWLEESQKKADKREEEYRKQLEELHEMRDRWRKLDEE